MRQGERGEKVRRRRTSSRARFEDIKADKVRCDDDLFLCSHCGRVFDGGGKYVVSDGVVLRYCRQCFKRGFSVVRPQS